MKNTLFWSLILLSMTFVTACSDVLGPAHKPTPSKPAITLNVSSSDFTTDGGSNTISFAADAPWTAEVLNSRADAWCSVSPTNGPAGDAEITITTTSNGTPDNRSASILLKAGTTEKTITISQKQKDALTVTSEKFEVSAEGGEVTIEVKANIDFEFFVEESAKGWIKYEATRAMTTSNLVFMVSKNDDADKREGTVIIESGLQKEIITIYQIGSDPIIVLSKNEYVVSSVGETIDVDVKNDVDISIEIPVDVHWITENTARAASTNTYRFDISANNDYNRREANVLFIDKENNLTDTVKVVQAPKDAIILSDLEYNIDRKGGDLNIEITSNVDFEIVVSEPWITKVEAKSLNTNTLHFYISACDDLNDRKGTITFTNGNVSQTISIKQDGILSEEKDALIAFYHATNGENWGDAYGTNISKGWLSNAPVGEWYGIETDSEGRVIKLSFVESNLSGFIPKEIGNLTKLRTLKIIGNPQLSGEIPKELGNCKELEYLYIEDTGVTGTIPEEIYDCTKLKVFVFSGNKLTGEISSKIGNLTDLISFGGHHNNLKGSIPIELGKLSSLEKLILSYNNFTGTIPSEIGNCSCLQWIDLSFNNFSGRLPDSFGNMPKLLFLGLYNNNLTGAIPSSIMENTRLWDYSWGYILSGNQFNTYNVKIPAPEFSIKDIAGNTISSDAEYSNNKLTILYQWQTSCPAVVDITPKLNRLYEKYRNQGLNIIGLALESTATAQEYFNTNNIKFDNVVIQNGNTIRTDAAYIHNIYSPNMIVGECSVNFYYPTSQLPTITIIDSYGKVVFSDLINNPNAFVYFVEKYFSDSNNLDGKTKLLQESTVGNGIELIVMGDGFSEESISNGDYEMIMRKFISSFFKEEPFNTYKDMFNVHMVNVVSASDGYDNGETTLGCWFGNDGEVGGDDYLTFGYALNAVSESKMDESLVVVLLNSEQFAGTCYMYSNGPSIAYIPIADGGSTFEQLIHHEACGHGFAKLADEYAYEDMGAIPADEINAFKEQQNSWGWWKNIDFTNDLSQIRWSKFIDDSHYAKEGLGAYEGGLTYWTGVWRPTENSIMRYNTGGFNAPSREAIYYRIHKLAYGADWQYDYEKFVEWDTINHNSTKARSLDHVEVPKKFKPLHAPVIKSQTWKDAK